MKKLLKSLFFTFVVTSAIASTNSISWTQSPFDQKVFIENKSQFDGKDGKDSSKILFGTSVDGVGLYFTATGLTYRHDQRVLMTGEDREAFEHNRKSVEPEEQRQITKLPPLFLSLEWIGANNDVKVTKHDSVSWYYTYANGSGTTLAHAWKKILYENLYPGIDIEYVFPQGKEGIKYSLIVHPGADISRIRMRYANADSLSLDADGNLVIGSSFGKFIDHSPATFYSKDASPIPCSFLINGNEVSFQMSSYNHSQSVVIDPWTVIPTFIGYNGAYDVNYDLNGNVYIYGSYLPYKLEKRDSTGILQWVFNSDITFGMWEGIEYFYGDFAVDEIGGSSYLVEGYNSGGAARVLKVNTLGIPTGTFPGKLNMNEFWRAEYNRCIKKIVIAGGGTTFPSYNAAVLDTDLVNVNFVQFFTSSDHADMALLAIDNNSTYCYMASSRINGPYDDKIFKCPIPNLLPTAFSVKDRHQFQELGSITYVNNTTAPYCLANGMNGMAVSPNWLYTYDSDSLKRWNKNTGAFVRSIHVSPLKAVHAGTYKGIQVSWGGLSVDECDNIYVGVMDTIKEYNSSLSLIKSFKLPGKVYDVKLGLNNKLYACGLGFVTQLDVIPNNTTLSLTQTPATCDSCNGTATVGALSCGGNPAGFSYTWNTNPVQITQTATNLCPGTYTVTVTTNCFMSFMDSVTVLSGGGITPTITGITSICEGDSTTLTASGGAHFLWNTGATTASITVHPLSTTNYFVTVTNDSGCGASDTVTVTVNPRPRAFAGNDVTICFGDSTQLNATGGNIYSWQPITGLSNPNIANPIAKPTVTTVYTVTVSNNSVCSSKDSMIVRVNPQMTYSLTPNPVNLGVTKVGATQDGKAVFTNRNTSNIHISNIHFVPPTFGTIKTPFPKTLSANDSLEVKFTCTAPDTGRYQGQLCITVDSMCRDEQCIPVMIEGASTCLTPQVASATAGKRPGDEVIVPIVLDPSTKFTNAKEIDMQVTYDPALLRFISVSSSLDKAPSSTLLNGVVSITIVPTMALPTPSARVAELHMQALLAPYADGKMDVSSSLVTLGSGEKITGEGCPETFSLDSSCVRPSELRSKSTVTIEGIYPNPSYNTTTLAIIAQSSPVVKIEVYDAFGRKSETLLDGVLTNGTHELVINTKNYANGIYFCRLMYDGHSITKEFNVRR